jgi:hypothetical protein
MDCAEYQKRIIDLALSPESVRPEQKLAQHLAICASCSEELQRRRALLARIDTGVVALVSADVPQSLAARIRQQIAMEDAKPRSVFAAHRWFWLAGAGAVVGTAAILLAFSMRPANRGAATPESIAKNSAPAQPAQASAAGSIPAQEQPKSVVSAASSKPKSPVQQLVVSRTPQPAVSPEPDRMAAQLAAIEATPPSLEVLIPKNQPIAVSQIVFAARRDQLDEKLLAQAEAKSIDPLEVKPIKIDSIAPPDGQQSNPGSGTGFR